MAKMTNTGIEVMEAELQRIEKGLRGRAMEAMLNAGAEVLIGSWKDEIRESHRKTSTRDIMASAVDKTSIRYTDGGASIEVYPMGNDTGHRITNASKAFILHHGRQATRKGTKEIKGDKFVTRAERRKKAEVMAAMQDAMNEFIGGKE